MDVVNISPTGSNNRSVWLLLPLKCVRASVSWLRGRKSIAFAVVLAALCASRAGDAIFQRSVLTPSVLATMNDSLPTMIDGTTRFDRIQMTGQRLTYAYTITDVARAQQVTADPTAFAEVMDERLCKAHADLGVQSTRFDYFDTRGALMASFTATRYICEATRNVIVAEAWHL